jgi:hypothetical protein
MTQRLITSANFRVLRGVLYTGIFSIHLMLAFWNYCHWNMAGVVGDVAGLL